MLLETMFPTDWKTQLRNIMFVDKIYGLFRDEPGIEALDNNLFSLQVKGLTRNQR